MADSATTVYGLVEPEVGASADSWGAKLNAGLVDLDNLLSAKATTGSSNAYVLTTGLSLAAYVAGMAFRIIASFGNTSTATLNVDGLGAKAITKNGATALASGDIVSGRVYAATYDGTQFQLGLLNADTQQPLNANLTALAALTISAGTYIRGTGAAAFSVDSYATLLTNIAAVPLAGGDMTGPLTIGDTAFKVYLNSGVPTIVFDTNDYLFYNRSTNTYSFNIAGVAQALLSASALTVTPDVVMTAQAPTSGLSAGYRGLGPVTTKTANYTFGTSDAGRAINHNSASAHAFTLNTSVLGGAGARADFIGGSNLGGGVLTITAGAGVSFFGPTGGVSTLTVNQYQKYSIECVDVETFFVRAY